MAAPLHDVIARLVDVCTRSVRGRFRRIPVVRQLGIRDCGPAALTMVLGFHGKELSLEAVRTAVGSGRGGASAESLIRAAHLHGLTGRAVQVAAEDLPVLPPATILHWNSNHFVVLDRFNGSTADIIDPSIGRRTVPMNAFSSSFSGVALVFERSSSFEAGSFRRRRHRVLLSHIWQQRHLLGRIVSLAVLVQLLSVAVPAITGLLVDRVVPQGDLSFLSLLAVGYCAAQIAGAVASFTRARLMIRFRTQLEVVFTKQFVEHLIQLPYSFFQEHSAGDLMLRMGSTSSIRDILAATVSSVLMDGTMAFVYLFLMVLASSPVTIWVVLIVLARLGVMAVMRARQKQLLSQAIDNQGRVQTHQVELLSGIETLKTMGVERQAFDSWSLAFGEGLKLSSQRGQLDASFGLVLGLLGAASTAVMMFYGTYHVVLGTWSLGTMLAFNAVAGGFVAPLNNLASSILQLQTLEVYVERLCEVTEAPPERSPNAVPLSVSFSGGASVQEVSFRYGRQDPLTLCNISIDIAAGACVALVGHTGSGKSTLARVLAGLYDPESGRVLFDGQDLSTLEVGSFRKYLGVVTQDSQLFGGTVRRNIALSEPLMAMERVTRAAERACLHDDIMAMPLGYETLLTDRGHSLSGGQRQRLALARALAAEPRILILDEATSHLDANTEARVNENLAELRCTRIVIAHRLSTVVAADLIVVLENGRIIERGTHDELLTLNGAYADLIKAQKPSVPGRLIRSTIA